MSQNIVLIILSLFVYDCESQMSEAPQVSLALSAMNLEDDLQRLANQIVLNIANSSNRCIIEKHLDKDWNETFELWSNMSLLNNCIQELGDVGMRLCSKEEIKFYFKNLYVDGQLSKFLKPNINCNSTTSWVPGCNAGWACARDDDSMPTNHDELPKRTRDSKACCAGFFCPSGITCMIPCPLGAYCPAAKVNISTSICEPYDYQIAPGNKSNQLCGSADKWADVSSTESIFCPPGFYCPNTNEKLNCTKGHFCRMGSTTWSNCLFRGHCDPNEKKENILLVGVLLMVALCVLLLIMYSFTGLLLNFRERREAKSREKAFKMVKERKKTRDKWRKALKLAMKSLAQHSPNFSGARPTSSSEDHKSDEPKPLLMHPIELSEVSTSTNIYKISEIIEEETEENNNNNTTSNTSNNNSNNISSITNNTNNKGKEGKHNRTRTKIFEYAYGKIEMEKEEVENIKFSEVFCSKKIKITRPLLEVHFKKLTLTLGGNKILGPITGKFVPGRVTAVMGPSGAGKTTFLNVVAGVTSAGKSSFLNAVEGIFGNACELTGSVLVNGKLENIRSYKKIIGFVPQDDIVHGDLTVEENLWFSARCRLPAKMPKEDKVMVVERVIESLGLQGIRNCRVGTVENRGISGGQRKRVNIGLEMVIEPSLLILDEPTSGLDSAASSLLLKALRSEALQGVNIVAVIHQPSYGLYKMFDELILLAKGGITVYHGSIENVEAYFSMLGMNVPDRMNPPDYFIDILTEGTNHNPNTSNTNNVNINHLPLIWILYNRYEVPNDMQAQRAEMEASGILRSVSNDERWEEIQYPHDVEFRKTPGIIMQYRYYLGRVVKQRLRDAKGQAIDYLILGLAGTCLGMIARLSDTNFGIPGYIYTIIAISLLCKIASLRSFSQDHLQFWRERQSGMSSLAYFLSKDTVDHFSTLVKPLIYLSMFYFFNNPRSTFADNYMVMVALVYCVTGVGYTFAICFQLGSAQLWSALLPVVLTLLSTQQSTPQILANLCYPKWALEAFVIANARMYTGVWLITRCAILLKSNFNINNWGRCIGVLFGYGLCFRIIAFVFLVLFHKK
ncbi:hypothetical protein LUZ60_016160 [Juncus effusus]|nr:hypothetical protein LUZ60_016160 [Juncus effusus]